MHDYPELSQFVHSLYYCRYDEFFRSLSEHRPCACTATSMLQLSPSSLPPSRHVSSVWAEEEFRRDRYLAPHMRFFVREMRIKAYTQLLESYRSLSLAHMAKSFGVSVEFIDR